VRQRELDDVVAGRPWPLGRRVLADPGAAAAAPAGLQCLLGARGPASTSRRRYDR